MHKPTTIHTSRTLMFNELSRVLEQGMHDNNYRSALADNAANKRTKTNLDKTNQYLIQLYLLDPQNPKFIAFKHFWRISEPVERPLLALLFAFSNDYLLQESLPVVQATPPGDRVTVEKFENNLEDAHPNRYSANTRRSIAQNLASSWKQAGYMTGKIKNMRTRVQPTYRIAAFALLLGYLHGERGQYLFSGKWAQLLDVPESQVRNLAHEAAKRELLQYNDAGGVAVVSFTDLCNQLGMYDLQS